jgi:outer membrane protein assembly factor BamB
VITGGGSAYAFSVAALITALLASCETPNDVKIEAGGVETVFEVPIVAADRGGRKPASDGSRLYAAAGNRMHAFDLKTGATLWSTTDSSGFPARIAIANGRVMWTSSYGAIAVDAATGQRVWSFTPDSYSGFSESDADADAFYFGSENHRVYALRVADGSVIWSRDLGASWPFSKGPVRGMTVSGDTVYAVVEHFADNNGSRGTGHLVALDRKTGNTLWEFEYGDGTTLSIIQSAVRVVGQLLLAQANWENTILAIDRFTGALVWKVDTPGEAFGPHEPPEVVGNVAYSGSHPHAEALHLATGTKKWQADAGLHARHFAACGNRLLVEGLDVSILDLSTGQFLGKRVRAEDGAFALTDFVVIDRHAYFFTSAALIKLRCPS